MIQTFSGVVNAAVRESPCMTMARENSPAAAASVGLFRGLPDGKNGVPEWAEVPGLDYPLDVVPGRGW